MVLEEQFNHLEEIKLIALTHGTPKQISYRLCLEDLKNNI